MYALTMKEKSNDVPSLMLITQSGTVQKESQCRTLVVSTRNREVFEIEEFRALEGFVLWVILYGPFSAMLAQAPAKLLGEIV